MKLSVFFGIASKTFWCWLVCQFRTKYVSGKCLEKCLLQDTTKSEKLSPFQTKSHCVCAKTCVQDVVSAVRDPSRIFIFFKSISRLQDFRSNDYLFDQKYVLYKNRNIKLFSCFAFNNSVDYVAIVIFCIFRQRSVLIDLMLSCHNDLSSSAMSGAQASHCLLLLCRGKTHENTIRLNGVHSNRKVCFI